MRDSGLVGQAGVGPAQLRGNVRVAHGEALDMNLVQDRVRGAVPGQVLVLPGVPGVHDQAPRHVRGGVQAAGPGRVGFVLAEYLRPEQDRSADGLGVRVEQQLGRVAPQAPGRVPGPGDAVAVGLPGAGARHEGVPDVGVVVQQRDLGLRAGLIEQTQRDAVGDAGGKREVGTRDANLLARRSAEREGLAGQGDGRDGGLHAAAHHWTFYFGARSRKTSPRARTAPWRRRIRSATRPVQPV